MKYKERDELVADLRELADLIETRGLDLPLEIMYPFSLVQRFYGEEAKAKLQRAARALPGLVKKDYRMSDLEIIKEMKNGLIKLRFETNRENVCEKRVVQVKKIPKTMIVTIPGQYENEEVVEWICSDSLLRPSSA